MDSGRTAAKPAESRGRSRFSVLRLVLVAVVLVIAWVVIAFGLAVYRDNRSQGILSATDYPEVRRNLPSHTSHMPATIPANATGVLVYAPGALGGLMPMPDHYVELRMVIPTADAAVVAQQFAGNASNFPAGDSRWADVPDRLRTADDADIETDLPAGFVSYASGRESGTFVYGVTINPTTGEVIYWAFDR